MSEEKAISKIAQKEEETLAFWKRNKIFEKSLEKNVLGERFIFFEGPPTANGRPGIHHLEARSFKDAIPRYKTMRGFYVRRKGGWDTHGLPVELEVEKQLGLKSKKEVLDYGIEKFNEACKESVWKYVNEWKDFTDRMGYWVDLKNPYVTYKSPYIESVWNIVKTVNEKGLLYKDYKVLPWCPRCETALSSHELAQGYKDVKDLSVYVKFEVEPGQKIGKEIVADEKTFLLAWTTTPWTLPGNVALAVGKDIGYVKVLIEGENIILAKNRLENLAPNAEIVEEFKGKDLIGLKYKPLYPFLKDNLVESEKSKLEKAFQVYPASFVTTTDGTGIVHTAVMYGQDDFILGTEIGLPKQHLVSPDGLFVKETGFLASRFVKDEDVAVDIIKDLASRGLLFKKEKYEHSYPFCWRCKTPLIYYARDSWYIKMSDLRDKLVKDNKDINWEPAHIKEGRFGEWLKDVKDWAISRERYWGTPLPVWVSDDFSEMDVFGSFSQLQEKAPDKLKLLFVVRHGESEKNIVDVFDRDPELYPLTKDGIKQAKQAGKELKGKGVNVVYSSPVRRAKETAEIIAKELGVEVVIAPELSEIDSGNWESKKLDDPSIKESRNKYLALSEEDFYTAKRGEVGESWQDVENRVKNLVEKVVKSEKGNVVLVTHAGVNVYINKALSEMTLSETHTYFDSPKAMAYAEPIEIIVDIERMKTFDPHKPFIDNISYEKNGKLMKRVSEVMDVWFDSGAMPFAQDHYPFENKEYIDGTGFPADFISEAIDQTRGWFYTLNAIGALLGKGKAYKNVICLGHLLDAEGKKMSKSLGNTVNPWEMMDKYGADALRFWMYSVNQPGESKNFDEKNIDEVVKKVFNLLLNIVNFYEMAGVNVEPNDKSEDVLDRWIIASLNKLNETVTSGFENYKLLEASRAIKDFIADFSQWYVRRSRDRFRDGDKNALATTRFVLLTLSKLMAPMMPFLAEEVYQKVKTNTDPESVHLTSWPEVDSRIMNHESGILEEMREVRRLVSLGLEARAKANIKTRQPLAKLEFPISNPPAGRAGFKLADEMLELIKDEVNVKEIVSVKDLEGVRLDTNITQDLKEEGIVRDLIREIQAMRKDKNLMPNDRVKLTVKTDISHKEIAEKNRDLISKVAGVSEFYFENLDSVSTENPFSIDIEVLKS